MFCCVSTMRSSVWGWASVLALLDVSHWVFRILTVGHRAAFWNPDLQVCLHWPSLHQQLVTLSSCPVGCLGCLDEDRATDQELLFSCLKVFTHHLLLCPCFFWSAPISCSSRTFWPVCHIVCDPHVLRPAVTAAPTSHQNQTENRMVPQPDWSVRPGQQSSWCFLGFELACFQHLSDLKDLVSLIRLA